MLDGLVVPLFQALYNLLHALAGIFWWLDQAILLVGYYLMALTDWLVDTAMSPLIDAIANQTGGLLAPIFVLAFITLGITYVLAVFGIVRIVDMRSSILWLLFAGFIYQVGPELYQGTESLRRGFGGMFYEEGVSALSDGFSDLSALGAIGTTGEALMATPVNQYGTWIPSDTAVDGLDVAMAYLYAEGCDVLRASGCTVLGELPFRWYLPSQDPSYFSNTASGTFFPTMTNDERQESLELAAAGIWRLASGTTVATFGMMEQVIHLVLALAMAAAYVSLLIGVLFAFFRVTEPIAWSVFQLVIELFVQSLITSLLLSIVISFVIIGATTANAVVLFGASLIGLILIVVLLLGALKAMLNATNRLMGAMAQATGGALGAAGEVTTLAASVAGGGLALAGGASLAQSAGVSLSGTRAAQSAYYTASAFGPDTAMGSVSAQIFEGAAAGRVFSPLVGGAMLPRLNHSRDEGATETPHTIAPLAEDGGPLPPVQKRPRRAETNAPTSNEGLSPEAFDAMDAHLVTRQGIPAGQGQRPMNDEPMGDVQPDVDRTHAPDQPDDLQALPGIGAARQAQLNGLGIRTYAELAEADPQDLTRMPRVTERQAQGWIEGAQAFLPATHAETVAAEVDRADDDDFAEVRRAIAADTPEATAYRDAAQDLPQAQAQQVLQQTLQAGSLGPQLAAAIRGSLRETAQGDNQNVDTRQIEQAAQAIERAAYQLADSLTTDGADIDAQVTAGRPATQTSQGGES